MRNDSPLARTDSPPPSSLHAEAAVTAHDAVAEANHRIANNLSLVAGMVRLYAREAARAEEPLSKEKVSAMMEEIGGRIEAIAHLHALLANHEHGQPIDLSQYLREIAETVVSSFTFARRAELSFSSGNACLIAPERALATGLVVGELVTNAEKYAHPTGVMGRIFVSCENKEGEVILQVADDGVGLPEGFDPQKDGGLGMRLVRSLADQLKAQLAFDDTGVGLSVALRMAAAVEPAH